MITEEAGNDHQPSHGRQHEAEDGDPPGRRLTRPLHEIGATHGGRHWARPPRASTCKLRT